MSWSKIGPSSSAAGRLSARKSRYSDDEEEAEGDCPLVAILDTWLSWLSWLGLLVLRFYQLDVNRIKFSFRRLRNGTVVL